jgi:hypothetical protein
MIAEAVQRYVLHSLDLSPLPEGVTRVQAYPTGELATGIAVETTDRGILYLLIRVIEFHHPSALATARKCSGSGCTQ